MRDLEEVIRKLGEMSANKIAEHFRTHGVYGRPRMASACPVAQYVKLTTRAGWVVVGPDSIHSLDHMNALPDPSILPHVVPTPPTVKEFIFRFDEHSYPDLEVQG